MSLALYAGRGVDVEAAIRIKKVLLYRKVTAPNAFTWIACLVNEGARETKAKHERSNTARIGAHVAAMVGLLYP